jgi:hypothetical protein
MDRVSAREAVARSLLRAPDPLQVITRLADAGA